MPQTSREHTVAGVRLTHPDRVVFPRQGLTKRRLAEYYVRIADRILPHLVGRPLSVVRCLGDAEGCFYQKHRTGSLPAEIEGIAVAERQQTATYIVIHGLPGLVALVQSGVVEIHPWGSREERLERPDRLIFDLDPGEGTSWEAVRRAAREVRSRLERLGLRSFLRTTGGKGLHVVVPLAPEPGWDELHGFARSFAQGLAADDPERYVAAVSKQERRGRVFVDYLRNVRGATAIACYSTRARPGAPVATPIRWSELGSLTAADRYSAESILRRLAALGKDPWEGFFALRQPLPPAPRDDRR